MKKHLIAAAVAAAVAVPAMAQVSFTGRIDTSVGSTKNQQANSTSRVNSSILTSNQLVFSGSEDLGGGLKAGFSIVTGFSSDAQNAASEHDSATSGRSFGTMSLGDRGAEVTVSGGFGSIAIGRTTGTALNSITAGGRTGNIGNLSTLNARPDNMVSFTTPAFNGFSGRVVYSVGDEPQANTSTKASMNEVSIAGTLGIVAVRAAYASYDKTFALGARPASKNIFGTEVAAQTASAEDPTINELGFSVDANAGFAVLNARFISREHGDRTNNAAKDFKAYGFGATVPLGGGLSASFDYASNDSKTANDDLDTTSATLVKDLSKRTNVYGAFAVTNDGDATKKDERLVAIGVRHSF